MAVRSGAVIVVLVAAGSIAALSLIDALVAALAIAAALVAAGGYAWGRWVALLWLGVLLWAVPAVVSDALWMTGIWDRSDEYEPLPVSMFVLPFGVPLMSAAAALGVAARLARAP